VGTAAVPCQNVPTPKKRSPGCARLSP
jgi:hypothetical protein